MEAASPPRAEAAGAAADSLPIVYRRDAAPYWKCVLYAEHATAPSHLRMPPVQTAGWVGFRLRRHFRGIPADYAPAPHISDDFARLCDARFNIDARQLAAFAYLIFSFSLLKPAGLRRPPSDVTLRLAGDLP